MSEDTELFVPSGEADEFCCFCQAGEPDTDCNCYCHIKEAP